MRTSFLLVLCVLATIASAAPKTKGKAKESATKATTVQQSKQVIVSDGNVIEINSVDSVGGKKITSMIVTKSKGDSTQVGSNNNRSMTVVTHNGKSTVATTMEAVEAYQKVRPQLDSLLSKLPVLTAENMPEYTGGMMAMMTFLSENVHYPEDAKDAQKEGRVICSFVVTEMGKVTDIKVVQSSGTQSLDDEAVRVVSLMPDWKPGTNNGEPVSVLFTVPIMFSLK